MLRKNTKNLGFSLIELLVSLSIFTIVVTMSVGCLLVLIDANAKAQNMQQVMTNITFALDSIAREVRTGSSFHCSYGGSDVDEFETQDCVNGGYLSLVEGGSSLTGGSSDSRIYYRYNSSDMTADRRVGTNGTWFPLTSADVTVTDMSFYVYNSDTGVDGDDKQAYVTIYIAGHAGELETVDSSFAVQTTVAKRILDI